uniref:Zinc finger SWIM-type containing 9 n=1 Tax=Sphenodon punctatus TaxID=8508 RepID=A0A8D0HI44_SPHPU
MEVNELQKKEFFSWEQFSMFFDAWCEQHKVLFIVKNSVSLSKCKWATAPPQPSVVDALKYSSVRLGCKGVRASGKPQNNRGQQKGCSANIVLKMSPRKDRLVVTKCQLSHNHAICPIEFSYYFKKGYLLANSCLPVRTTNRISKRFVGASDVSRLLSYCKSRDHGVLDVLTALDGLFARDPDAKVKLVFQQDKVIVQTVFFLSSRMMELARRFPLMLFFDHMVGLNAEFDLYTVLCVDGAGRGHEVAYCLTQRQTPELLRFTLVSLVQSVPEVKARVRCVTLGADIPHLEVVQELLPGARVQICRSQVLEMLFSKAQELGAAEDARIWPLLCSLAAAPSAAAYHQAEQEMQAVLPSAFLSYYRCHWQPRSQMWVQFWAFETARNVNACELLRRHQRQLLSALSPSPTAAQCILDLLAMPDGEREGDSLDEEELAARYHALCLPEPAGLIAEELGFARHGPQGFRTT